MTNLLGWVLPWWSRALAIGFACVSVFLLGQLSGERIAGERHLDYVSHQATQTVKIVKAHQVVGAQVEIKWRDRIEKVYLKGDEIEKQVPVYVTSDDNTNCSINAGFVRVYNAAWTSDPPGPAADSDRESAGLSLAAVAEVDSYNAKICLGWREQALGWREFYSNLQQVTNKTP